LRIRDASLASFNCQVASGAAPLACEGDGRRGQALRMVEEHHLSHLLGSFL
jgi:hypothetical protein